MKFKIDGKMKPVVGVIIAIVAAINAFSDVRNTQMMEDEIDELKSKVANLEGKES